MSSLLCVVDMCAYVCVYVCAYLYGVLNMLLSHHVCMYVQVYLLSMLYSVFVLYICVCLCVVMSLYNVCLSVCSLRMLSTVIVCRYAVCGLVTITVTESEGTPLSVSCIAFWPKPCTVTLYVFVRDIGV